MIFGGVDVLVGVGELVLGLAGIIGCWLTYARARRRDDSTSVSEQIDTLVKGQQGFADTLQQRVNGLETKCDECEKQVEVLRQALAAAHLRIAELEAREHP